MSISSVQCRTSRALTGWSRAELAEKASVNERTIIDFERGARSPIPATLNAIRRAFEDAGLLVLDDEEGGGEGARWSRPSSDRS